MVSSSLGPTFATYLLLCPGTTLAADVEPPTPSNTTTPTSIPPTNTTPAPSIVPTDSSLVPPNVPVPPPPIPSDTTTDTTPTPPIAAPTSPPPVPPNTPAEVPPPPPPSSSRVDTKPTIPNASPDAAQRPPLRLTPLTPNATENRPETWPSTPGQLGLTVGVPFFDESILHGDLTVDVRYGRKFWWLVPYLSGGFRQTRMDPAMVPYEARKRKLLAWHVTAGVRLEIPATRKLFPFVGIAGELAYWAFTADSSEYCHESFYPDAWRCYKPMDWKPGRAIKPQIGLLYKPEPSLALEFWVEHTTVYAPGMFTRRVTVINPAVGVAWHH